MLPANEYASVRGGSLLVCRPRDVHCVTGLVINEEPVPWAVAGDQIIATLQGIDITKMKYVIYYVYCVMYIVLCSIGSVLSDVEKPARVCTVIQARVLVFDIEFPITQGYPVSYHLCRAVDHMHAHALSHKLYK